MAENYQNIGVVNVLKEGVTLTEKDYFRDVIKDSKDLQKVNGNNNSFLEYVSQVVNASPIGARCLAVKKDYVRGAGLSNLSDLKVNENETLNEIHKKISDDIAYSHRFCVLVYSKLDKGNVIVSKIVHLPIEWVRYSLPDKEQEVRTIKYNPFYNTVEEFAHKEESYWLFENKETTKKRLYNLLKEQQNEICEAYYYVETSEINRIYSHPYYFQAGENAFLADAGAWLFHRRNIDNNFFLGGILQVQGRPDMEIEDKFGVKRTLEEIITGKLQTMFAGGNSAGSIMTLFKNNNEESDITYEPITSNNNDEKLLGVLNLCRQYIPTIMGVPSILAGVEVAGKLGDSKEKQGAVKFMNDSTKDLREAINNFYKIFFGDVSILKIQEQLEIPDYVWNTLTPEQKQKYIEKNYPDLI